jgi:hypothetical protein
MADEVVESADVSTEAESAPVESTEQVTPEISGADETASATENADSGDDKNSASEATESEQSLAVDPAVFARAIRAGLSEDDVVELGSEAAVMRTVTLLESRRGESNDTRPGEVKEAAVADGGEKAKLEAKAPEWKLDLPDVDENIVRALNSVPEYVKAFVEAQLSRLSPDQTAMKQQVEKMSQYVQSLEQQRVTSEVDSWVAAQGQDWEKILGKGSIEDLDQNGEAAKARQALFREAKVQEQALLATGKRPSIKDCLDRARAVLHPKQVERSAQKKLLLKAKSAKGTMLARPSNRPGVPGIDDAEKEIIAKIDAMTRG